MPLSTIHDNAVARFHMSQNADDARHSGNPATAGDNRRMTGLATALCHDPMYGNVPQGHHLRRQQFIGHDNQGSWQGIAVRAEHVAEVRADADDHVADIVQPVLQIRVARPLEQLRVVLHQSMQCSGRGQPLVNDPAAYFFGEVGIAQNRFVHGEDRRFRSTNLIGHLGLQRSQVAGCLVPCGLVSRQLRTNLMLLNALPIRIHKDLVNAVRRTDRDPRRNRNAFSHVRKNSPRWQ